MLVFQKVYANLKKNMFMFMVLKKLYINPNNVHIFQILFGVFNDVHGIENVHVLKFRSSFKKYSH